MTKKNENMTPDDYRDSLLDAIMTHVAFDGWSDKAMKQAAEDIGIDPGIVDLAFPDGAMGMLDLCAQRCDLAMLEIIKDAEFHDQKIREKITALVRARIEIETPHKEAANRAAPFVALPQNHYRALKILYRTVDLMWKAIGDQSTDFNYYTKRMTLSAVYSSTFLYWLNDESEDHQQTWEFLDRRIENVMQFEKFKFQNKDKLPDLAKVWRKLGEKRYGS
ncbi:COQ9 family protein [Pseudemcibacter aquimaris]|uniref:COQ9 family protein n=1 Tax=Pseudemcibacter aquimaris TaxID=2857064 RepID=UPI0020132AD1|nr:COQ9 family protein [Pseudemcibacter aquimaris]MCC3861428.1 COQ9 family protein [Pseudemcibacter aquimaris]WDU58198.1 COQ9 family protein [Pseudemcibacter aquimaris]